VSDVEREMYLREIRRLDAERTRLRAVLEQLDKRESLGLEPHALIRAALDQQESASG